MVTMISRIRLVFIKVFKFTLNPTAKASTLVMTKKYKIGDLFEYFFIHVPKC